jgi:pimeloyl-ACP methyl ester carboxylesterase
MVNDSGSRVTLGGWSLGGVVAREFARQHPEAARHAINYGTPVVLGPRFTALARLRSAASVVAAVAERLDVESPTQMTPAVVSPVGTGSCPAGRASTDSRRTPNT